MVAARSDLFTQPSPIDKVAGDAATTSELPRKKNGRPPLNGERAMSGAERKRRYRERRRSATAAVEPTPAQPVVVDDGGGAFQHLGFCILGYEFRVAFRPEFRSPSERPESGHESGHKTSRVHDHDHDLISLQVSEILKKACKHAGSESLDPPGFVPHQSVPKPPERPETSTPVPNAIEPACTPEQVIDSMRWWGGNWPKHVPRPAKEILRGLERVKQEEVDDAKAHTELYAKGEPRSWPKFFASTLAGWREEIAQGKIPKTSLGFPKTSFDARRADGTRPKRKYPRRADRSAREISHLRAISDHLEDMNYQPNGHHGDGHLDWDAVLIKATVEQVYNAADKSDKGDTGKLIARLQNTLGWAQTG